MTSRTGSSLFSTSAFVTPLTPVVLAATALVVEKNTSLKIMDDKAKIQEGIKMQGEVVRKLKAEKASKEQVSEAGKVLIAFFSRFS